MSNAPSRPLISRRASPLQGRAKVPGDKSISHRSMMFGAVALVRTTVTGLMEGEDFLRRAAEFKSLGA